MRRSSFIILVSVLTGASVATRARADAPAATTALYANLPLAFEENRGQADPQARFLARGPGYSLLLTPTGSVLSVRNPAQDRPAALRMRLDGANPAPVIAGQQALPGRINYFLGRGPAGWRTGIPTYAQVRYHNVYPGIDLLYYGNQRQLEYDFVVQPGSDPGVIRLAFPGAALPRINQQGDLVLHIAGGDIYHAKPVAYQQTNGVRRNIAAHYALNRDGQVAIRLGAYDPALPLVIDPYLFYASYLGGPGADVATAIAVDAGGNVYLAGYTDTNYPVPAIQPPPPQPPAGVNAFVAKLSPDGTKLLWGTYLGGNGVDHAFGIALRPSGTYLYVAGDTGSTDFPMAASPQPLYGGSTDAFVARLAASSGSLSASTYLGGSGADGATAVAVDDSENVYVAGTTGSNNFPTANAYQSNPPAAGSHGFVAKIASNGSLAYSTYLGGAGLDKIQALALDSASINSGLVYLAGGTNSSDFPEKAAQSNGMSCGIGAAPALQNADAFVAALDTTASGEASLNFSMRLGGDGDDIANGIAVRSGYVYVAGETRSSCAPYPNVSGSLHGDSDAFVAYVMTPSGSQGADVYHWTYLGGTGDDRATSLVFPNDWQVYLSGETSSCDFPGASRVPPCGTVAFVANLTSTSNPVTAFSAFLGPRGLGFGPAIAVPNIEYMLQTGNIYVTGSAVEGFQTSSTALQPSFAGGSDAFVAFLSHLKAEDQSVSTHVGTPVSITLSGSNADDCTNCSSLSYAIATQPQHGSLTGTGNPYSYQPSSGFIGTDRFSFTVHAGSYTSFPATVTITVPDEIGPTVTASLAPSDLVAAGSNLTLTVTASDVNSGGSNIAGSEYCIWTAAGELVRDWTPIDGTYNSPEVTVSANIVAPATPVLYWLFVRAQDASGNAAFSSPILSILVYDPATWVNGSGSVLVQGAPAQFDFTFKYTGKSTSPSGSLLFQSRSLGLKFKAVDAGYMGAGRNGEFMVRGDGWLDGVGWCDFSMYLAGGRPGYFGLSLCNQFSFPPAAVTSGGITIHAR